MANEGIEINEEVLNGGGLPLFSSSSIQSDDSSPTEDEPEITHLPVAADDEIEIATDDADTDFQERARVVASNRKKKKCTIALIASAAVLAVVVGLGAGLGTKNGNKSVSAANNANAATLEYCLKEEEKALEEHSMEGMISASSTTYVPTWMPTTYLPTEATGEEESAAATMGAAPVRYSNDFADMMMDVQNSNDGSVRRDLRGSSAASKVHELKGSSKSRRLQCDELLADHKSTSSGGSSKNGKSTKTPSGGSPKSGKSTKSPKGSNSSKMGTKSGKSIISSGEPSTTPSLEPSLELSTTPSLDPSTTPSLDPSALPSLQPSPKTTISPEDRLIITGVIDGPLFGGKPKAIELYAMADIPDMSAYTIRRYSNDSLKPNSSYTFDKQLALSKGDYISITTDNVAFNEYIGRAATIEDNVPNINGDDAFDVIVNGKVADVFGEVGKDGSGTWAHEDGWAYRKYGSTPSSMFQLNKWKFSGPGALTGCTTNDRCASRFPMRTFDR